MLKVSLVTPEKKLFTDTEVEDVYIPGYAGELNILPGHAPLITTLQPGELKYRLKGQPKLQHVAIGWGYCEVYADSINILAETAEFPEDIDFDRAKQDLKDANADLAAGATEPEEFERKIGKARLAEVRLEVFDHTDTSKMN